MIMLGFTGAAEAFLASGALLLIVAVVFSVPLSSAPFPPHPQIPNTRMPTRLNRKIRTFGSPFFQD